MLWEVVNLERVIGWGCGVEAVTERSCEEHCGTDEKKRNPYRTGLLFLSSF